MNRLLVLMILGMCFVSTEAEAQLKTKLQITVINDLGNIVEGATVTLYRTEEDYDNEENAVQTATTDEKGRVIFKELEPRSYFMLASKGDLTNIGRGVKTTKLIAKKKNMLNVVIE